MSQLHTQFAPASPTYITPISCPYCTASAHLVRRSPAITSGGRGEIRVFECTQCSQRTDMFIRD